MDEFKSDHTKRSHFFRGALRAKSRVKFERDLPLSSQSKLKFDLASNGICLSVEIPNVKRSNGKANDAMGLK